MNNKYKRGQCLLPVLLVLLHLSTGDLRGADLTDPKNASILDRWGYLNVIAYGADPTGRRDSTREIQQAIDDGAAQRKAVLVPLGTYLISDTLECYKKWVKSDPNKLHGSTAFPQESHILIGEKRDGNRPLIKLATSAEKFDDGEHPRPMLAYALFKTLEPDTAIRGINPLEVPVGGSSPGSFPARSADLAPPDLFDEILDGINFDCSGHRGAVGIFFPAAQKSLLLDVAVSAEGAHTGIYGIPGRNSGAANLSVTGGRFGLVLHPSEAGVTVVGLSLHGQTERALVCRDFVPACIVGFEISAKSAPVITLGAAANHTATGTLALIDGQIETEDRGPLIDNRKGKAVYLRNVYAPGPGVFITSGSLPGVGGTGAWYEIAEYCYTDQSDPKDRPPYAQRDTVFRMFSLINGQTSREPQPSVQIRNDVPTPVDYARKHLYASLPQISFRDSTRTINVTEAPYNAKPDRGDNWEKIQRAIDDAEKDGRVVYVPKGTFLISRTLELRSKTRLIGLGCKRNPRDPLTVIAAHPSWKKTPGNAALILTVDDPDAETFLGGMNFAITENVNKYIHWRAGKRSTMMNLGFSNSGPTAETTIYFSGNGGGRHYLLEPLSLSNSKEHRHVRMVGTSQPLSWYGCNLEAGGKGAANLEMVDASNVRIYGIKREGRSPTLIMDNCRNIGIFTQGAMREGIEEGSGGYVQIRGASDGLLMPLILVQVAWGNPNGEPLLVEALEGKEKVSVTWPEAVSLYKRGELDDRKMYLNP